MTVSRSSFIAPSATAVRSMPRSRASCLAAAARAWRVVDGVGRDGAVPVVGADDLPAGAGGLLADGAGQAGDAGVVVDLDVDLVALDRLGLRLGLRRRRLGSGRPAARWSAACRGAAATTSRSVGSSPRVATNAIAAMATATMLSITTGEGKTTLRWSARASATRVGPGHRAQTSKPRRRAERWRWRSERSRRRRRTRSGSTSRASGRSIRALRTW